MKYVSLLVLGLMLIILGVFNMRGDISSIHWYNRWRISEADRLPYGRWMGAGTMVIGGSLALTGVVQMVAEREAWNYIILLGAVVGVALMLWAQFKYNKGIF